MRDAQKQLMALIFRLGYFLQVAFTGMARARVLTAASTLTLAAALFVVGALGMALLNARDLVQVWGQGGHISCGLRTDLPASAWEGVRRQVAALPGVRQVRLEEPQAALEHFRARGPEAAHLVEGVAADMLPAALYIEPTASLVADGALSELAASLRLITGVEDVEYGQVPLNKLRRAIRVMAVFALSFAGLFAVCMVFIVTNTIRLMIYGRQDEVRILRLVGATAWFVRAPFLLEGLIWGTAAGLLGALGLWGLQRVLVEPLAQARAVLGGAVNLRLFCSQVLLLQVATGALLGLVGSFWALHHYLDEDTK